MYGHVYFPFLILIICAFLSWLLGSLIFNLTSFPWCIFKSTPFLKQDFSHITQVMISSIFIIGHFKIFPDSCCGLLPSSTLNIKLYSTALDDTDYSKTDQNLWMPFYILNKPELKYDSFRENHDNHLPKCSATHRKVSSPIRWPNNDSYLRYVGTG